MINLTRHVAIWVALIISFPLLAHANGKGKWVRKEVKGTAPDFTLTNQDEQKVTLKDFRGKVVLMSFIYTKCPAACPLTMAKLAMIYDALKAKDLHIVAITIDPAHDTPAVLKEYGKQWKGVDFRSWSFLTGAEEEMNNVLYDYKTYPLTQAKRGPSGEVLTVDLASHPLKIFLVDRKGVKRFEYQGQDFNTKVVMKDLEKVLGEGK